MAQADLCGPATLSRRSAPPAAGPTIFDVTSRLLRFWDASGSPIAVVPFALTYHDAPASRVSGIGQSPLAARMRLRLLGGSGEVRDTEWRQAFNRAPTQQSNLFSDGVMILPLVTWTTTWSLVAAPNVPATTSGGDCISVAALPAGSIVVSDLALGAPPTSVEWDIAGAKILLGTSSVFDRNSSLHVTYQARSRTNSDSVHTSLTVTNVSDPKAGKRVMQVTFPGRLEAGISLMERTLDMSGMKPGRYLIELQIGDARGGGTSVRSTEFTLK